MTEGVFKRKLIKSRDIPLTDLYELLQLEYISYKFRSIIYKRDFDIKKYEEICEKKKEKIDSISLRNTLPSIFNKEEIKEKYFKKFFNEWGLPNFCYRDDYQRMVKGYWDKIYYFSKDCSVRIKVDNNVLIGQIDSVDIPYYEDEIKGEEKIFVKISKDIIEVGINDVSRIVSTDFFDNL
jgi:hypothetical protein